MTYWKIDSLYDGSFYHGHPRTESDPRIRDDEYIFQFIKTAPSIFYETPLKPWLVTHCIDTTIITGCTTSVRARLDRGQFLSRLSHHRPRRLLRRSGQRRTRTFGTWADAMPM